MYKNLGKDMGQINACIDKRKNINININICIDRNGISLVREGV